MKLTNETAYDARVLRALLTQVHVREAEHRGRLRTWKRLTVKVVYRREGRGDYTGHAYLHGGSCVLSIPRGSFDTIQFAALWRHELWHLYGMRHRDYSKDAMTCAPSWVEGWVEPAMVAEIEQAPAQKPTVDDRRAAKMISLAERMERWESKKRRAERAIAKIRKSLRYYEKAAGKIVRASNVT